VSGFGFRVSGSGFQVSGFGFQVSGFGFRVMNLEVGGHDPELGEREVLVRHDLQRLLQHLLKPII